MQTLIKEHNKKLEIARSFVDGGEPAVYGQTGGMKVLLQQGAPARATVHMGVNLQFFYDDGSPVDKLEDVEWLPERISIGNRIFNPRDVARQQVEAYLAALERGEKPPKVRAGKKGGVRVSQSTPQPRRIEIKGSEVLGRRGGTHPERVSDPDRVAE